MSLDVAGLDVDLSGRPILRNISFAVESGQWLGLVGPNGSGKSTLLRALVGEIASRGGMAFNDVDLASLSQRARARLIASVPQRPTLPAAMLVSDYVLLGRTPHISYLGRESKADFAEVAEAMAALELSTYWDRPLSTLSGGEQQRAILARAIAQDAPLLLLDEPTTALDIGHQQSVLGIADTLRRERGLTLVSSLHDLTLAAQYCDRLVLLEEGRIAGIGSPDEVLDPAVIARIFGTAVELIRTNGTVSGVVPQRVPTRPAIETPTPPSVSAP